MKAEFLGGSEGWIEPVEWTQQAITSLPRWLREQDLALTHCDSIVAAVGDPACDPRSGGLAGNRNLARFYSVGPQQFKRNILPELA